MGFLSAMFLLAIPVMMHAQFRITQPAPLPDVLGPAPKIWYLGLIGGLNQNWHDGTFQTTLCSCTVKDGTGKGMYVGVELAHPLNEDVAVALRVMYDDKRAQYTSKVTKEALAYDESNGTYFPVIADYENQLDVRLSYLVIQPVIEWTPLWNFYVTAGPAFAPKLTSTYTYKQKLLSQDFVYLNSETDETNLEEDGDIASPVALRIDVRVGIGYNLKLGKTTYFAPEVSYGYPLTKIAGTDDWFANTLHVVGVLKIRL